MEYIHPIHQIGKVFFGCRYPCLKISLVFLKVQLTTDVDTTQRG